MGLSGPGEEANAHALERLVFFSDAVFAVVITLLVIELRAPELSPGPGEREWGQALLALVPSFGAVLLSFMVIAAFWMNHHALFGMVRRYHVRLLWPNLLLLLTVAFIPFATSLLSTGSLASVPYAFYAASLLVAGLAKARLVRVALGPDLLDDDTPPAAVAVELRRRWIMPVAATATLALAFVTTPWCVFAMLLVPLLRRASLSRAPMEVTGP